MGIDLIGHPELAAEPANSAFITVDGMTNGTFTGVSMSRYINNKTTDFYHARAVVNGDTAINGQRIAGYAQNYLTALQGCKFGEPAPSRFR